MTTNEKKLERSILRGDFAHAYLIYVRKSTDDEDNQRNSLAFQKLEIGRYIEQHRLPIAGLSIAGFVTDGIAAEKHSAFKVGDGFEITKSGQMVVTIERPKFSRLLFYLEKKCFKGVVFYSWDRSCRNDGDEVALKRLIGQGVDIRFVTTDYENSSAGALHMDVDGMFAKHHSRLTREKVTNAMRQLRQRGVCTYKAPVGYLNQKSSEHKPFDPERAPWTCHVFVPLRLLT